MAASAGDYQLQQLVGLCCLSLLIGSEGELSLAVKQLGQLLGLTVVAVDRSSSGCPSTRAARLAAIRSSACPD